MSPTNTRPRSTRALARATASTAAAMVVLGATTAPPASAHGYVGGDSDVVARAAMPANNALIGNARYEPQSFEAPKGFPDSPSSPADGQLASAGGLFGGLLDRQSADLWAKNVVQPGPLSIGWRFTAPHNTSQFRYWITKNGWDPEDPLERDDLQLLSTVPHDGSAASANPTHQVQLPADHRGYHVIYAVWDIADTTNAFYNVIDLDIQGEPAPDDVQAPSTPTGVTADPSSTSVALTWPAASDDRAVTGYTVRRDGAVVGTTSQPGYTDQGLTPQTAYSYTVTARDAAGNESGRSTPVAVTTLPAADSDDDDTAPSAPAGLHTMDVTASTVDLMWSAATDDVAVTGYTVERAAGSGAFATVGSTTTTMFTDTGLSAGTEYRYRVVASDGAGNTTAGSELVVRTQSAGEPDPGTDQPPAWDPWASYRVGDRVSHDGTVYRNVQGYTGHGDPSWIDALSLWQPED